MYRKGTSHSDLYKMQDTKDAGHMSSYEAIKDLGLGPIIHAVRAGVQS
jgi:hypothetical protein